MASKPLLTSIDTKVVDHFADHLKEIVSAVGEDVGVEAFHKLVDDKAENKISGRLFYVLDKGGERVNFHSNIKVDDELYEDIEKLTHKGKTFDHFFDAILEQFGRNVEFIKMLNEYEKNHPGQGEQLQRALVAQAAVKMYEDVIQTASTKTKAGESYHHDRQLLMLVRGEKRRIKDLDKKTPEDLEKLKNLEMKDKQLSENMKKLEPAVTKESKAINAKLEKIRQQAIAYRDKTPENKSKLTTKSKAKL